MPAARKPARQRQGRKPTLSPTRITTYLQCAVKYRYIYQDKLARFYQRAHSYYSFGSTLHQTLQEFHEQGAVHTPEEMVAEMQQRWIGAGYENAAQETEHREAGRQIVQAYHAAHRERVEAQVETIATEKTVSWDMGEFKLSGRIDRIDRHSDGTLEIVDYKSGRWEPTPEEVADDLAMNCYQLILARLNPGVKVFATIYSLRSGTQASAILEGAVLLQFENDIRELGNEILARDYSLDNPVRKEICGHCDFLALCDRHWRRQVQADRTDEPFSDQGI